MNIYERICERTGLKFFTWGALLAIRKLPCIEKDGRLHPGTAGSPLITACDAARKAVYSEPLIIRRYDTFNMFPSGYDDQIPVVCRRCPIFPIALLAKNRLSN